MNYMYSYLNSMVAKFLSQGSDYTNIALGSLVQKSLNNSYSFINETLPLDLTTRMLASYNKVQGKSCKDYMSMVLFDEGEISSVCQGENFTDINDLKTWVNATWYTDSEYSKHLEKQYNLTAIQIQTLFDPTIFGSLGQSI